MCKTAINTLFLNFIYLPECQIGSLSHSLTLKFFFITSLNSIGAVMINMLVSDMVDHKFDPQSGQTKDFKLVSIASPLSLQH